jgi:carbonic anhydrase/acetyltransferase-like protein (isoleucine patch superfamily)
MGDRQPVCAADTWVAENATLIGSVVLESWRPRAWIPTGTRPSPIRNVAASILP